jgi:hypothetical protein
MPMNQKLLSILIHNVNLDIYVKKDSEYTKIDILGDIQILSSNNLTDSTIELVIRIEWASKSNYIIIYSQHIFSWIFLN